MDAYLIVNFGGPRSLEEIPSFLEELLSDQDVVRTKFPPFLHRFLFRRIARKRAKKIAPDYAGIGGRSPIYFDTEELAQKLREKVDVPVLTFHRYLPATHKASLQAIEKVQAKQIRVIPLFPQFSYATTGSIARFLGRHLCCKTANQLRWIPSYAAHPRFIESYQRKIGEFLKEKQIPEEEVFLLFSAHGIPRSFVCKGDLYQSECETSYKEVAKAFPKALSLLSYQSKFGPGEWLRPYTEDVCRHLLEKVEGRKQVVVVPITFTSDHIETLFEIEEQYLPLIRAQGLKADRCPALNLESYWIDALFAIAQGPLVCGNQMLIRNSAQSFCCYKP